jgi:NADH dehydrogenase
MIMEDKRYIPNIPESENPRLVIIGGGFAGLKLVKNMLNKGFQIILLDKNNFHQFQPLLYQVATAGLEPSAISFPLRKILQRECNVHFRVAEIQEISSGSKEIRTNIGYLKYDYLVLAMGTNPNFFGHVSFGDNTLPMKSAADAILIRNMKTGDKPREFEYRDKPAIVYSQQIKSPLEIPLLNEI